MIYKRLFNRKLERKCPKVKKMLDSCYINTETFILDWMYTIYTRSFSIKLTRVFWDIYLVFGEYYLIRIAYSIFALLKKELSDKKNMEDGLRYIRGKTGTLLLSKLVKHTLREVKTITEINQIFSMLMEQAKEENNSRT